MIVGIGVDVVDIARFQQQIEGSPRLAERLFSAHERELPLRSLAARYAAKEALIKALGWSSDIGWHDMPVVSDDEGNPSFALIGGIAKTVGERGITRIHL